MKSKHYPSQNYFFRFGALNFVDKNFNPSGKDCKGLIMNGSKLFQFSTKEEALRLLRTNSVKENFYSHKRDFEQRLCNRGYPTRLLHKILTEVQFSDRTEALRNKTRKTNEISPFVTTYDPATPNLKKILMKHWHIIQQQPRLAPIFKQPPIVSYRKEKSLKDVLVHAKLPLITPQS